MQRSAEIIEANEDLLVQILLSLPIKSLFQFKCVSTRWLNLISSPYFSRKHSLKNLKCSPSGLFLHNYASILYISLETIENSRSSFGPVLIHDFLKIPRQYASNVAIRSFSSGLLLCVLVNPGLNGQDVTHLIINPTTMKSNLLPPLQQPHAKPVTNMDLAFNPHESPHYRVVCVRQCGPCSGPFRYEFLTFSSETGSGWHTCQGPFPNIPPGTRFSIGVYWNNGMHYLNAWGNNNICDFNDNNNNNDREEYCFYFKFEEETVERLALPPAAHPTKRSWYMGQSCGHLHLVDTQTDNMRGSSVDIYELAFDYSGWVRLYRVDLGAIGYVFPEMVKNVRVDPVLVDGENNQRVVRRRVRHFTCSVVSVVRREGEEFLEIVFSIPKKIISYNPRRNKTRVLWYFGDDRDRDRGMYQWNSAVPYVETLTPV